MPDDLDREIRSLVVELVESSPQSRSASMVLPEVTRRLTPVTLRAGLVRMALVAGLVLAGGVAGALVGRYLLPGEDVAAAPAVIEGTPSLQPEFSTAELGTEVLLLPPSGDLQPDVDPATLDGDVIAAGRIDGTDVEVFSWMTTNPAGSCIQVISSHVRDTMCSSTTQPTGSTVQAPYNVAHIDPANGEPVDVVAVWRVPEGTSIVTAEAGDTSIWQRPVAGIAAVAFDPDTLLVMMGALTIEGSPLGGTGFSPYQVANPDPAPESMLEAAEEDLVELTDSHPARRLIAEGAASQDVFAGAAQAEDLAFTCAAGAGLMPWELCLVAADGVLAVVPFESEPGLVARISQPRLSRDVLVPLDSDQPVGIRHTGPQVTVDIEYLGERIGGMSAPAAP